MWRNDLVPGGKVLGLVVGLVLAAFWPLPAQDASPAAASSDQSVSFQTFYDSLASEGIWIQTADYGYVWQPAVTDSDWAPYTNGHWVYTEDGWTWASNEPWGWAAYHYGRWVNLDGTGWCWVPGYTWGPAWVSWRYGGGYCAWAPLPPDSLIGVDYAGGGTDLGVGFHIGGDCDSYYGIGAAWYNFLPIAYLGDSNYRGYYVNRYDNYRLINQTTNVTNLNVNRNGAGFGAVTLGGPSLFQANAQSQTPIRRLRLAFTDRVGGGAVNGRSFTIFAPRVNVATVPGARPEREVRSLGQVKVNRGTDISHPLLVSSQLALSGPTPRQIEAGQSAQAAAPARARVATMNMAVRSAPLTAMRPVVWQSRPIVQTSHPSSPANSGRSSFQSTGTGAPGYHGSGGDTGEKNR
jgi:hypothetical protein